MTDYQKYINALRKCANEHENDRTFTGHIIVSDLCRDTANLLEELSSSENPNSSTTKNNLGVDCISREQAINAVNIWSNSETILNLQQLPSVTPQEPRKGHWINKDHSFETCSAECSSCHKRSNGYMHDNGFSLECKYYDFCPKCGSDNREVEE